MFVFMVFSFPRAVCLFPLSISREILFYSSGWVVGKFLTRKLIVERNRLL